MNKKMLALYGLKWNPFAPDVPVEALHINKSPAVFSHYTARQFKTGVEPIEY